MFAKIKFGSYQKQISLCSVIFVLFGFSKNWASKWDFTQTLIIFIVKTGCDGGYHHHIIIISRCDSVISFTDYYWWLLLRLLCSSALNQTWLGNQSHKKSLLFIFFILWLYRTKQVKLFVSLNMLPASQHHHWHWIIQTLNQEKEEKKKEINKIKNIRVSGRLYWVKLVFRQKNGFRLENYKQFKVTDCLTGISASD